MGSQIRGLWRILTAFRGYRPQSVTPLVAWRWLNQFPLALRFPILSLLDDIVFVSEKETEDYLRMGNVEVLNRLESDGFGPENIIYVSLDLAGSSSGVMLNILRDIENMERRHAKFIHSSDGDEMTRFSNELGGGAIVYVDDFAGTGRQFRKNRDQIAAFIAGNFSEFFIAACMCEEAIEKVEEVGVISLPGLVHHKSDRPLHDENTKLSLKMKRQLVQLCMDMNPEWGLGFKRMATMAILARNAPNSTPLIFRGNLAQYPVKGIFPRWDDMPI